MEAETLAGHQEKASKKDRKFSPNDIFIYRGSLRIVRSGGGQ